MIASILGDQIIDIYVDSESNQCSTNITLIKNNVTIIQCSNKKAKQGRIIIIRPNITNSSLELCEVEVFTGENFFFFISFLILNKNLIKTDNLAFEKPVHVQFATTDKNYGSLINDHQENKCFKISTESIAETVTWISIDLIRRYIIYGVDVLFPEDYSVTRLDVSVTDDHPAFNTITQKILCGYFELNDWKKVYRTIICDKKEIGQYLLLETKLNEIKICELEIFGANSENGEGYYLRI